MSIPATHKAVNLRWLSAMALLDAAILAVIAGLPALGGLTADVAPQLTSAVLLPPLVLLASSLVPPDVKHQLVFWRRRYVLPGHRAFSVHALKDARFDIAILKKRIGRFPVEPGRQNSRWYELYKTVQDSPSVADAHRSFLLFRDLASISALLAGLVGIIFSIIGIDWQRTVAAVLFIGGQYLLAVVASRFSAHRFVRNVLAEHAVEQGR